MKSIICVTILMALIFSVAGAEDLKRLGLDDTAALGTVIQSDTVVKKEGKQSVKITTKHPTTICLAEVKGLDLANSKLIYVAQVKSDLKGRAYLEMWAHFGGDQYFSKGINDPIHGKTDWKPIQTPFLFQKDQQPDKLTLNIVIEGTGTVWIDDARLSKMPL